MATVAEEPDLTVAAVARRLGVAPGTLRSWERRYGLGPAGRAVGSRRRYTPSDLAVLTRMRRLTLEGVAPAEAARVATEATTPAPTPPPDVEFHGHERVAARARGLARAALALDVAAVRDLLGVAVANDGVIATWELLLAPALRAIGVRWASTGQGVEVEHLLAEAAIGVFNAVLSTRPAASRATLLACADGERHSLPLHALAAALAERGTGSRLLGAALPPDALAAAVRRTGPAALVLYAHTQEHAVPALLDAVPAMRPRTAVLVGGAGWVPDALPDGVTYVHDLAEAVHLVLVATGAG
ncbi:MAG: MerR family transcriptional regulator, light-induced transcriptional regulator [Frankiaceae bacterium]|jgi:DNA-binding transcriptional MerR regulator|nr:MerR family transcriptional regulator, light-induced transcriptional regulator [Frankiaceae bacterium]